MCIRDRIPIFKPNLVMVWVVAPVKTCGLLRQHCKLAQQDVYKRQEQLTDDGTMDSLKEGEDVPPFTITLKDVGFNINDIFS